MTDAGDAPQSDSVRPADGRGEALRAALKASIETNPIPCPDGDVGKGVFNLVRRVKRVSSDHGLDPDGVSPRKFANTVRTWATANGLDAGDVAERFNELWPIVRYAEGVNPVQKAVMRVLADERAGNRPILQARFSEWPSDAFQRDATRILAVLDYLKNENGIAFATCEALARELGMMRDGKSDSKRAWRVLKVLEREKYIDKTTGDGPAQRYRIRTKDDVPF